MKKSVIAIALCGMAMSAKGGQQEGDTLKNVSLEEVGVIATRATETTPVAYTNITQEEIEKRNFGQDLPYLLSTTPSVITTSDAGAGIGYTSLRVRGVDATRINVTSNGIPVNDAESHGVFWVNMPDLASSVKDIQVQRGAGTSTNGAGAFGASVNLQTGVSALKPYAEFSGSYGSFNTHKATLKAGTGLINDHWTFDVRLSNIATDGYIDRASADLNSYFFQAGYYNGTTSVKLINFTGKEQTYHAWNYASKEEMEEYGRSYNSCGYMYTDEDGRDHFYDDQTDNYVQKNWQLLIDHAFSPEWELNVGLHYTKGDGYYQEYKTDRTLVEYMLIPYPDAKGKPVEESDLVRRKAMDNGFGGGVFSLTYKGDRLNAAVGGALNQYDGDHFGRVLWVKNYEGMLDADHEYYRNTGKKLDGNLYLKGDYRLARGLHAYADLQYRHIGYTIEGTNDKWNSVTDEGLQRLDIDETFDFFNPKAGLSWQIDPHHRLFASFSVAQKEPTRNNYTDGHLDVRPKAERLFDYELGYTYADKWLTLGANLYYMDYKDQLVLTGELNEIGEAMAANVPESYRMGVELMAGVKLPFGFSWDINATLSRNRIKDFVETLYQNERVGGDQWITEKGETHIAFSPDVVLNNRFAYTYKGLDVALQSQYVGKQYMSNADCEAHRLDAYFVSNLSLAYTFKLPHVKSVTVGCTVYNLFNEEYENNGYAGSGFDYDDNHERVRYDYAGYAAQAGTNFLAHVAVKF